ncbi:MAG TPA: 2Fe-2S iron-sulfur cluster-binding protein [Thermoplasmata archaeon]|nr:2Fe-2S iron-sulfur cluster-binding protein [Thermoplasmata archaeon]
MPVAPSRTIRYDGRPVAVASGETLLSGIVRVQRPLLQRSVRYHRPRGPFCGVGHCTGCLLRVNGRPNVRACRYEPADGDVATTENAWPSARFDLLGALDAIFPGGIDTLHGFRRPAFATRAYQRVVRALAGYGTPPTDAAARALAAPPLLREAPTVVIGAGTSGRATAARLVERGERPLLIDRGLHPLPLPGADLLAATTVAFLPPPSGDPLRFALVGVTEPARGVRIRARSVVVATGAYDGNLLFGGNDRPGILTGDGAEALVAGGAPPPFHRAIVVGGGDRAREIVERFGPRVHAVVSPGEIPPELVRSASDRGVRLFPRTLVVAANGRRWVRSLELKGRGAGPRFTLAGDAVILAHRRLPNVPLLFQAGARMTWHGPLGAYLPAVDPDGATTVPGLFAVGPVGGAVPGASAASGGRAADRIGGAPSAPEGIDRVPEAGRSEFEGYYRELLRGPRPGRWIACPCEDVLWEEIETAHARGYAGIEVVKRYTGLGTGLCQGRYCTPDALLLLGLLEQRDPGAVGYLTQRPPVVPTPIAALAALPADGPEGAA